MKKLLVVLFAAAALAVPRAQAQDSQMFNHLGLGVTVGLMDGFGIDAVLPMGPKFQIRAGYAIDPISVPLSDMDFGTYTSGSKTVNLNDIPLSVSTWKSGNGHLMFDFYPSSTGGFHISAGAFINNGKFVSVAADASKVLDKADWGTLAIGPDGGSFKVSTDGNGVINMDVKTWAVMPYIGLGFGRALNPEKTFNFVFDMGLFVWGSPTVQSYDYTDHYFNESKPVKTVVLDGASMKSVTAQGAEILDLVSSIPVCPYMRFGFYFKLF